MKTFDLYESVGVVAPGSVLLFGLMQIYPGLKDLQKDGLTLGEFGVFVLLAFVGGHLLQTIGDLIAQAWWKRRGGLPTDWVRTGKPADFTKNPHLHLPEKLKDLLGIELQADELKKLTKGEWAAITKRIYSTVEKAGRSRRVDVFNGNYGMFRGCVPAFLIVATLAIVNRGREAVPAGLLLVGAAGLALARMDRFAVHYANELFVQFAGVTPGQLETKKEEKK